MFWFAKSATTKQLTAYVAAEERFWSFMAYLPSFAFPLALAIFGIACVRVCVCVIGIWRPVAFVSKDDTEMSGHRST